MYYIYIFNSLFIELKLYNTFIDYIQFTNLKHNIMFT